MILKIVLNYFKISALFKTQKKMSEVFSEVSAIRPVVEEKWALDQLGA